MKNCLMAWVLGLVGVVALGGSSGVASAAEPAAKLIDIDREVLSTIEINVGQKVFFKRNDSEGFAKKVKIGGSEAIKSLPEKQWPVVYGGDVLNGFEAKQPGTAEVTIESHAVLPNAPKKVTTVRVIVKGKPSVINLTPKSHSIEFGGKYPATLDINQGDSIVLYKPFKGDPGLFDPIAFPQGKTTDGKPGDVLKHTTQVVRLDVNNIRVAQFDGQRAGTADIVIERNGKVTDTIKVTVKALEKPKAETPKTETGTSSNGPIVAPGVTRPSRPYGNPSVPSVPMIPPMAPPIP